GHLDVLGLLIITQRCGRARTMDAVDRTRIVALVLQRHLSLTNVVVALHLACDLVLSLAGLGPGLVHSAIDLVADGVALGLGLVRGLVVAAAELVLDLVLGLGALFLGLVPSLGGLLLGLIPRLGRLFLHGVLGVGSLLFDRLVVVRSDGRQGAPREPQCDGQC